MSRPNILFIHSDQHRYDCVGVNGHTPLQTPHLDQLAADGINFRHAYTPVPLCTPARVSLLHGQWPTEHLAISNWRTEAPRPAIDNLPSFSQALRDGGYWLGYIAKWHAHPTKTPRDYGFHEYVAEAGPFAGMKKRGRFQPDAEADSNTYDGWRRAAGIPPRPRKRGWFGEIDPHITPEQSRLAWGADQVIRMLGEQAEMDAPFFIRWDPSEPHLPNVVPEPFFSLYPPETIPPWPSFPDPLTGKPYIQAQQRRTWEVEGWRWKDWAPTVSAYLGEIALLDAQIGRVLAALDQLGLTENTLVIYTSDHGDMCGAHGMMDKHFVMYDDVVRVPLIMRWPEQIPAGTVSDAFVAHSIDLATTFCRAAGVPVPDTFRGEDLLPVMTGARENGRQDIFSMYQGALFGLYSQRMVRDDRWKYIWNAAAEDELYDLQTDPAELHNRAADSACRTELARLRRRLVGWMDETGDLLLNPWIRKQLLENLKV